MGQGEEFRAAGGNTLSLLVLDFVALALDGVALAVDEGISNWASNSFALLAVQLEECWASDSLAGTVAELEVGRAFVLEARAVLELITITAAGSLALSGLLVEAEVGSARDSDTLSVDFLEVLSANADAGVHDLLEASRAVDLLAGTVDQFESGLAGGIDALAVGELGAGWAGSLDALVSLGNSSLRAANQGALLGGGIKVEASRAADSSAGISDQLESIGASRDLQALSVLLDSVGWACTFANTVLQGGTSRAANGEALLSSEDLTGRAASSNAITVGELEVFIASSSGADTLNQGEVLFTGSNALVVVLDETVWAGLDDTLVVNDFVEGAWALGSDALLASKSEVVRAANSLA